MQNEVDKYLGPNHKKLGTGSYELAPILVGGRQRPRIEFGGGYNNWGLNEGPRRGEGGPGRIRSIATPNVMAEFMNEQIHNQRYIDQEYVAKFSTAVLDSERDLEKTKQAAKGSQVINAAETAVIEQQAVLDYVESKISQYNEIEPAIYGLYGKSPYFLMNVLPRQKMSQFLDFGDFSVEGLVALYTLFDTVYKSAMELKLLSQSTVVVAGKLAELARNREQAQVANNAATQEQQLGIIVRERNVHAHLLPEFLYAELVTAAGVMEGLTTSQALARYKATLERMAAARIAAIKPVHAHPPYRSGGFIITLSAQNPAINAPLSKPELEALNELVYLQAHTELGVKWQSYHDALLNIESARHLTATANAFGDLAERAGQAEAMIDANVLASHQGYGPAEWATMTNTFRALGLASAARPFVMTSAGAVAVIDTATVTLQAAIRSAIVAVIGLLPGLFVGLSALVYSPKLANGELPERYALSTPLSDLDPEHGHDLSAIAAASGTVDLPVRLSSKTAADGQSEVFVAKTDGVVVPSKVRVVAATFNPEQKVYSVTTSDVPPRTLTWTPIVDPGNQSTTSPVEQPVPAIYAGATVTPVMGRIDIFPALAEAGFDDFITVFPVDSGLPPLYVMFRDPREDSGVATGRGQPVTGNWLGAASHGEGAPVPSQIADLLRGREFRNFRAFREAFWKAVANDVDLAKAFSFVNLERMRKHGYAPYAVPSEQVGGKSKFEIHHVVFLRDEGELYDMDNLRLVTPKKHDALHKNNLGE